MPRGGTRFKNSKQKKKLNIKKVILVILIPVLIIMGIKVFKYYGQKTKEYNIKRTNSLAYFSSIENDKWGVIDSKGNTVIENKYDEMIVVPNKSLEVFIVTDVKSEEKKEYETKVINKNESEILKNVKNVKPIEYDSNTETYDQNLLLFTQNGKIGLVDYKGTIKFEAKFEEVKPMKNIVGKLLVKEDRKIRCN